MFVSQKKERKNAHGMRDKKNLKKITRKIFPKITLENILIRHYSIQFNIYQANKEYRKQNLPDQTLLLEIYNDQSNVKCH